MKRRRERAKAHERQRKNYLGYDCRYGGDQARRVIYARNMLCASGVEEERRNDSKGQMKSRGDTGSRVRRRLGCSTLFVVVQRKIRYRERGGMMRYSGCCDTSVVMLASSGGGGH